MAIYHFSAKMISRANGSSALAAAAYRSASRLHDQRLDRYHDFSNKAGVVHSEIVLPAGAPDTLADRERLWNEVEAAEIRKDAQLAREIEFALPRELNQAEGIRLARDFVAQEFVACGMIADLNVHWDVGADGEPKPHAHVMLTTRDVGEGGFGAKVRDWNRTDLLEKWREAWAEHVNTRLAELDIDARIDHRSLEAQGIDLEPQHKIGAVAARMAERGLQSERLEEHHAIARANGEKLLANPALALDAITRTQATFTTRELAMFVHRHSDGKDQFDRVMATVRAAPELIALGKDGRGQDRFTSRDMLACERRLERAADRLAMRRHHAVPAAAIGQSIASAEKHSLTLEGAQRAALEHVVRGADLTAITGYAGTGKSAMLGIARDAWSRAGFEVHGLALSGIAAENLEAGSGIASRTIASLEHQWSQGRDLLTERDVLVIDEAGMIGTRQMERVIAEAEKRGAKVVLVGDPEQLQAIEAGAAFRSIAERHGAYELTHVRRQRADWMRDATRWLATERTPQALEAYSEHGAVHAAETRGQARAELVDRWDRDRQASLKSSCIILTHTNEEVQALNALARQRMRESRDLGEDVAVQAERGERRFASGDRILFLKNERSLGVKNGSLGRVESVNQVRMVVLLDDGRSIAFDLTDYDQIDHGYAATIHKAQGMTVDRAHVLATPGLDRHAAYVALSRHRDSVELHYGRDDFADEGKLARVLSRERGKDMASEYLQRGRPTGVAARPPRRDVLAGLGLPMVSEATPSQLDRALERVGRAVADIMRLRAGGSAELPHQRVALDAAAKDLNALRPDAARDLQAAFRSDPKLVDDAAQGRTAQVLRAMALETELHDDRVARADRFVADWNRHARRASAFDKGGERWRGDEVRTAMTGMAKGLQRDPQLESLLKNRIKELGIGGSGGSSLSHDLQNYLGLSRGRGISI
ncbi:Ti-type conjugative transfer relaxase TraA [Sphingomonas sp. JC676]|uniref:Ti-type conjugative transfer relaxase TraA n=1 Tax=Sphingomonas sp. JC676 TaxID=2768065 RepID=UPI0016577E87|nr:Ti-type conjugative transfer relaxase TraA [Sphingomonas sp. JC676]MBC9035200.1 Ti-type conjugative transfer relaxase TraA [Sphingomonas sp. JC676]